MIISIISAMSINRVIGKGNKLPWHIPGDTAYFKKITAGKKFIMGRKSYESPDMLCSGKGNVVVTRQENYQTGPGAVTANSIEDALGILKDESEVFIIGGEQVFKQSINKAAIIYLTVIQHEFEGDAYFPEIDSAQWKTGSREDHIADDDNPFAYSFIKYIRRE